MKKICAKTEYEVTKLIAEGGMGAVYQARLLGAEGFEKIVRAVLPQVSFRSA